MAPVDETYGAKMTTIASRVASICALIDDAAEETMSARLVAAISAMIQDVAEEAKTGSRIRRERRCMNSTRSYEKTCTLGEGGFGVVAKARHRTTDQTVVLKALQRHCGASVEMLLREACFMAACGGHPNTVALGGIARSPGTSIYSIVIEYVGPNLHSVLHDRIGRLGRPFTEAEVCGIMRQLLSGAAAMHGHRIIHQDINPENIFVVGSDDDDAALVVKIGDYGLAMSTAEQNVYDGKYSFAGKTEYMAPEILLWKDYDTRVDTWSLGCVMAKLLTGETLFQMPDTETETEMTDRETDQLYKIFDLLGVPGKKPYRELKSPFSLETDEVVDLWRREQQKRARHGSRLREMFPEKTLSNQGFEVLSGLLTCIPSKRLDAAAALQLPWFADTDHHAPAPVVSNPNRGGAAATFWALASCSWQMALACIGRALRSFRPMAVYKS